MNWTTTIESHNVAETIELGRRIGSALASGDIIALVGPLGAGKTHLTKGLALGLGARDERQVSSPTFVLVNQYRARVTVFHVDAYRLTNADQLEAIGFSEMCTDRSAVVIVEWADRVKSAIDPAALWIELHIEEGDHRRIVVTTINATLSDRLARAGLDHPQPSDDKSTHG